MVQPHLFIVKLNRSPSPAQDLATLVNDQGQQLDTIESNITLVADRTADAGRDLVRAERSQRSARNRMCYILLVIGLVLAVLVVVLSL